MKRVSSKSWLSWYNKSLWWCLLLLLLRDTMVHVSELLMLLLHESYTLNLLRLVLTNLVVIPDLLLLLCVVLNGLISVGAFYKLKRYQSFDNVVLIIVSMLDLCSIKTGSSPNGLLLKWLLNFLLWLLREITTIDKGGGLVKMMIVQAAILAMSAEVGLPCVRLVLEHQSLVKLLLPRKVLTLNIILMTNVISQENFFLQLRILLLKDAFLLLTVWGNLESWRAEGVIFNWRDLKDALTALILSQSALRSLLLILIHFCVAGIIIVWEVLVTYLRCIRRDLSARELNRETRSLITFIVELLLLIWMLTVRSLVQEWTESICGKLLTHLALHICRLLLNLVIGDLLIRFRIMFCGPSSSWEDISILCFWLWV